MTTDHAALPDAGRVSHFEIDAQLPAPNEKGALRGTPATPMPSDTNRYLTESYGSDLSVLIWIGW